MEKITPNRLSNKDDLSSLESAVAAAMLQEVRDTGMPFDAAGETSDGIKFIAKEAWDFGILAKAAVRACHEYERKVQE